MNKDVLVVIPVYNEEDNIGDVLKGIKNLNLDIGIIVIDDGSTDNTKNLVIDYDVDILSLPFNFGYGNALQLGFKYAIKMGYNYVIQFDGDGQHIPESIDYIIKELKKNEYDIVIGSRFCKKGMYKISFMKKVIKNAFGFIIKTFTGCTITDPTSGLQGLSRKTFGYYSKSKNFPDDFPDADVLMKMLKLGFKITEIPVNIKQRKNGISMHSGLKPIIYMIKIILSIIVVLFNYYFIRRAKSGYRA